MPAPADRAKTIFLKAVEIAAAPERLAYLDAACAGDAALRREVEDFLRHHDQLGSFLEGAVDQPATGGYTREPAAASAPLECLGTVIGHYKLLQQIGEGGMGTVFMAEQTQPVQRKVALKIIKPGMDSRQVIARFEAERQALALMDHPNIARVLDAGTTEGGRPYFVMELVKGVPITKYCDEHHLTPRERLELFVPVCQAVQHAHQKGVIHRDLKPGNVLVCLYDGRPVPKVIDFGIAKAAGPRLTEKTLFTELGQVVGTLEYMSPEQAELNQLDVDTRSDIYSLGVLLYELLTGSTPLERKRFQAVAFLEVLRLIREEESPKPSTRLSTTEGLPSIAANRGVEPKKLSGLVRGELDWIVMKALEKNRNRRYETANAFAADVERYLHDETVLACPPSAWYRFRKFARRHKVGLALAGLILFFLVLLGGGGGWVMRDQAARRAQIAGDVNRALREAQVLQGQQKWPEALAVVRHAQGLLTGSGDQNLRQRVDERVADLEVLVKLEDARLRWSEVKDSHFDFDEADAAYAKAFRDYGVDVEALEPKEAGAQLRARDIRVELAAALDGWVKVLRHQGKSVWQDRLTAARAADPDPFRDRVREAVARDDRKALEELADDDRVTDLPGPTLDLFVPVLNGSGAPERSVALLGKAQRRHPGDFWINLNLASCLRNLNPVPADEVIRYTSVAKALRPQTPVAYNNLAHALMDKGRLDEAMVELRAAIRLQDNAIARSNLGNALREKGQPKEAIVEYREAIRLKKDYAGAHNGLALVLAELGRLDEAIGEWQEVIRLDKNFAQARRSLGQALYQRGRALWKRGRLDDAIAEYRQAIHLDPDNHAAHNGLGVALLDKELPDEAIAEFREAIRLKEDSAEPHNNLGDALRLMGLLGEAIAEFRKAVRLAPDEAGCHSNLGVVLAAKGLRKEAIAEFREAIRIDKNLAAAHLELGRALDTVGRLEEALAEFREAVRLAPNNPVVHNALAWFLANCRDAKFRDPPAAVKSATKAVELLPSGPRWNTLGVAQYRAGNWKACAEALQKSMALSKGGTADDWFFLAMTCWQQGDKEEAHKWHGRATEWMEKNKEALEMDEPHQEELRRFRAEAAELIRP